jgi:DNA-binding Lrp family transcriptional regulator
MSKLDTDLIYLQTENARISLKELSEKLSKSSQRLKYSLNQLIRSGIIRDPYTIIDYSYFGLILFRVYFRGAYVSELEKINIVKELSSNPYIVSIYELTGEFDLSVEFAAPNPSKFHKELKNLIMLKSMLNDYKIVLNLVTYICPRLYLVKQEKLISLYAERIVGGDREQEQFTNHEMSVLKTLSTIPNMRYTEMAKKIGLNVKTVRTIMDNLIERKIIRGFKYILDTTKIGVEKFRLFLRLHNVSPERENQLKDYFLRTPEIVQVNKTVGDWDMELDIETMDRKKIREVILELREDFKDIIERFNIIEFYRYYKRSYLPQYLFKEENSD